MIHCEFGLLLLGRTGTFAMDRGLAWGLQIGLQATRESAPL